MTDPSPTNEQLDPQHIAKAVRFALASVVLGFSYLNLRCAAMIPAFQQIYTDMLGRKPLALDTSFVIHARPFLLALSIALPVCVLVALRLKQLSTALYILGWVALLVFGQLFLTWSALMSPLITVLKQMQGG